MRNFAKLAIFGAATVGFWFGFTLFFHAFLFPPEISFRAYFGFITVPDLLRILAFAAWAYLIARVSIDSFNEPHAKSFRRLSAGFVVVMFLHSVGVFIPGNFGSEYCLADLGSAAFVALSAWAGLRCPLEQAPSIHADARG